MIVIHTDGGARGNGKENNIGGWAAVLEFQGNKKEIKGATKDTTNNKMELLAVIKALETLKTTNIPVAVYSDSSYVVNGIGGKTPWINGWIKRGWKNSKKQPVANRELWLRLYELKTKQYDIEFYQVKGHADNEGNNRADTLVNEAMDELIN